MAKNKIVDLRDHMFAQLERLSDEEISKDQLEQEIKRAHAMHQVAKIIVESAKAETQFLKLTGGHGSGFIPTDTPVLPNDKALSDGKSKRVQKFLEGE